MPTLSRSGVMNFLLRTGDGRCVEFEASGPFEAIRHEVCQRAIPGAQLEDMGGEVLAVRELRYTLLGWIQPWRPADSWVLTGNG